MRTSDRWALVAGMTMAFVAPGALGQTRPTTTHAMAPDGSIYYAVPAEGTVVRVAPDGASELIANDLDTPTGVAVDTDGNLLVADEVGTHRVDFAAGTIAVVQALPTEFRPEVRFDQAAWTYRPKKNSVRITFTHNLKDLMPLFDLEVSKNGGRTWQRVASGLTGSSYVWHGSDTWPISRARFRVSARVDGQRVASDVSDNYGDDSASLFKVTLPQGE